MENQDQENLSCSLETQTNEEVVEETCECLADQPESNEKKD